MMDVIGYFALSAIVWGVFGALNYAWFERTYPRDADIYADGRGEVQAFQDLMVCLGPIGTVCVVLFVTVELFFSVLFVIVELFFSLLGLLLR